MKLIGANYDRPANMFNFYFQNEQTGKYSYMCVSNIFGASDMYHNTPHMYHEDFEQLQQEQAAFLTAPEGVNA